MYIFLRRGVDNITYYYDNLIRLSQQIDRFEIEIEIISKDWWGPGPARNAYVVP